MKKNLPLFIYMTAGILIVFGGLVYLAVRNRQPAPWDGQLPDGISRGLAGAITELDNTRTFSLPLNSFFTIELDGTRFPKEKIELSADGQLVKASSTPEAQAPFYTASFVTNAEGSVTIKTGDFNVTVNIYNPEFDRKGYRHTDYGFAFNYLSRNILVKEPSYRFVTDNSLARIDLPQNDFSGTNLNEAVFIVGASKDRKILAKCLSKSETEETQGEDKTLYGKVFKVFEGIDAAAGNRYETRSYRTVAEGTCYEAVLFLHYGNIQNYPEGAVKEFDKDKAWKELGDILITLNVNE